MMFRGPKRGEVQDERLKPRSERVPREDAPMHIMSE